MPQYSNPKPTEGINYSKEHPLKEFVQLLLGVFAAVVILLIVLNFMVGTLARYIPFEFEKNMVSDMSFSQVVESPQQTYLQDMADRISAHMNLPEGMTVTVHYRNTDMVNAFATLGGNLYFFQGLINQLETEDALAMVMAHEIAHVKHRHPIVALGKGITIATLMAFITGASGSKAGEWLIGSSANIGLLKFSRDQEKQSDESAAKAIYAHYGHIGGAKELFLMFDKIEANREESQGNAQNSNSSIKEIFRSHPYSKDRSELIEQMALKNGWPMSGTSPKLVFPEPEQAMAESQGFPF